mgnify:CR=1 FL=1
MNKINYKYKLGELVVTSAYYRNSPDHYGVIVERVDKMGMLKRLYRVNWIDSGYDSRWIFEDDLLRVDDGV